MASHTANSFSIWNRLVWGGLLLCAVAFPCQAQGQNSDDSADAAPKESSVLTVAELQAIESRVQAILPKAIDAVVRIRDGSGVIVSPDGWVLTAAHVCPRPGGKMDVRLANGVLWPAETYGVSLSDDLGLVRLKGFHKWPYLPARSGNADSSGHWCFTLGYPWNDEALVQPAVRIGRILQYGEARLVSDVPIIGGDSGGPVISLSGELIGINSRIRKDDALSIHTSLEGFLKIKNQLYEKKLLRRSAAERADDSVVDAREFGRNAKSVQTAVTALVDHYQKSVVRLTPKDASQVEKTPFVVGTIVSEAGLVVAKYSDLKMPLSAEVTGQAYGVTLVGKDESSDLALLQLKGRASSDVWPSIKLDAIAQGENADGVSTVGRIVFSLTGTRSNKDGWRASMGTLMLPSSSFDELGRYAALDLGVEFAPDALVVRSVFPQTLGYAAGLQIEDRLISIGGKKVDSDRELRTVLANLVSGKSYQLVLKRRKKTLLKTLELPKRLPILWDRWGGGPFSERRFGFGDVLVHDGLIQPEDCGGPLFDLQGRLVGINVSRALRNATFAVPVEKVKALVDRHRAAEAK